MAWYFNNEIGSHYFLDGPILSYIIRNIENGSHYWNVKGRVDS